MLSPLPSTRTPAKSSSLTTWQMHRLRVTPTSLICSLTQDKQNGISRHPTVNTKANLGKDTKRLCSAAEGRSTRASILERNDRLFGIRYKICQGENERKAKLLKMEDRYTMCATQFYLLLCKLAIFHDRVCFHDRF